MAKNIMFVDDEAGILKSLKWVFANEPYCYLGFDNPEEALAKMEETEIAVVVTDQRMPEMEGIQFLERVKERWPDTIRWVPAYFPDLVLQMCQRQYTNWSMLATVRIMILVCCKI